MELQKTMSDGESAVHFEFFKGTVAAAYDNENFALSVGDGNTFNIFAFKGNLVRRSIEMLLSAFNNRTRQRNYFRLYCDLLDGQLSDEEFDKEIDEHPDDYVVSSNIKPTKEDLELAIMLSKKMKDIDDVNDLSMAFSFDEVKAHELARQIEAAK